MLFQTTLIKVVFGAAVENALKVTPSIRLLVNLEMLFQVATTSEFLIAIVTCKRLFARVDALMAYEVRYLREGLFTARIFAAIWFGFVVDACMFLQR